jgi:hypothetical protein
MIDTPQLHSLCVADLPLWSRAYTLAEFIAMVSA